MKISKLTVGAVVVVALAAAGFGVREFRAAAAMAETRAAALGRSEDVRTRIASLEKKLVAETKRAEAVESDNAALASAVQKVQAAVEHRAKAPVPVLSRQVFDARVKSAVAAAKGGEPGAALSELLACWELGKTRVGGLEPVHSTQLLAAMMKLGEQHPPALAVLREKIEKARQRVLGSPDDMEPLKEMSAIARMLKEDQAMVALFDAIPEGDARRGRVAIYAVEGMIAAKRYSEALVGRNYASMSSSFESSSQMRTVPGATAEMAEKMQSSMRSYAVTSAAKNIEVLAGAGDLGHARELAGRVLALDGSEATLALLQKHLERAGQAGLLKEAGK
jgi:hypothetical protein